MIRVHCADGEVREFPLPSRYCTDEHNNLELMSSKEPLACFVADFWVWVEVVAGEQG